LRSPARTAGFLLLALLLVAGLAVAVFAVLRQRGVTPPVAGQQRCVASAGGGSVALDLEQAHYASIIVGLSVKRGLAPRAGSIAIATAYQESGIRNLDYGDRDSVGLFQQRPSQGWGSEEQLRDPYYATDAFYDALVEIDDWETGDINDVAQQVQVSGYPEAYRDHERDARIVASALTGQSRAAFSCLDRTGTDGDAAALRRSFTATFGNLDDDRDGGTLVIRADSARLAWAYGHHAVANASRYGVAEVTVGDQTWRTDDITLPRWAAATDPLPAGRVRITVR
jgi:hypothetical protein